MFFSFNFQTKSSYYPSQKTKHPCQVKKNPCHHANCWSMILLERHPILLCLTRSHVCVCVCVCVYCGCGVVWCGVVWCGGVVWCVCACGVTDRHQPTTPTTPHHTTQHTPIHTHPYTNTHPHTHRLCCIGLC